MTTSLTTASWLAFCRTKGVGSLFYPERSAGDFERVLHFGNLLLPVKLFLNRDMGILENYLTYAVPRLKFIVDGWQYVHVPVTVGSIAHEDM